MTNNTHFLTRSTIKDGKRITETLLFTSFAAMDAERYAVTRVGGRFNIDWGILPKVDPEADRIRF
jgi:hypothetical protein